MDTQYPDVEWGLMLDPTFSGGPIYGNRGPDVGFTVTSQQEANLDATWKLYRYLVSPAYLARYCVLRGIQPSLKSMWTDPAFSEEAGPHWATIAIKNRPENSVDWGFNPRELTDIIGRVLPSIRDEGEDITAVLQREEAAGNEFLSANPQWSILSAAEGLIGRDRFGAGNAVTLYNWTWFNGFMDTQYPDIEWGIMLDPTFSGGPVYGNRGPDVGFTVTSQQEGGLDASWKLYRYLVSPDYLAKYCKLRGVQPSLKAMWTDAQFSDQAGPHWGAIAVKNKPENSVDWGFNPRELGDIVARVLPAIRDEGEDITTVCTREEQAANDFLKANPQWSILSAADYQANPQWLTAAG
jgi:hypothetical protein